MTAQQTEELAIVTLGYFARVPARWAQWVIREWPLRPDWTDVRIAVWVEAAAWLLRRGDASKFGGVV